MKNLDKDKILENLKREVMSISAKMTEIDITLAGRVIDYMSEDPYEKNIAELKMQKGTMKKYKEHLLNRIGYLKDIKTEE